MLFKGILGVESLEFLFLFIVSLFCVLCQMKKLQWGYGYRKAKIILKFVCFQCTEMESELTEICYNYVYIL